MSEPRYPVSTTFKVLDGHDMYRSNNLIVALVVVESQYGRDLRLYRWMKRNEQWNSNANTFSTNTKKLKSN